MNLADLPVESNGATVELQRYQISTRSDIGLVRQGNEDNFYVASGDKDIQKKGVLVGVADGMGGHNAGEVASQVAVETLATYYDMDVPGEDVERVLADMIRLANDRIIQLSNSSTDLQGLGTTLTALLLRSTDAVVAHVGDCRIYLFRDGVLSQLTLDHSLVQEAVREGILTPEQARVHPQRNIITRALGTQDTLDVDSLTVKVQPGDLFMLSSDGLHGLLEDYEIEEIIANGGNELDQISQDLVQTALDEGGNDNVTVILVKVPTEDAGA
jgi:serine/threonine protein phosphatase PrpC